MALSTKKFADSAQAFTKSPLGIVALFIVLIYGFASLTTTFGDNLSDHHLTLMICFQIFFPVFVFSGFLWLVVQHPDKIYGPPHFQTDEGFIMYREIGSAVSLAAANARKSDNEKNHDSINEQLESIIKSFTNKSLKLRGKSDTLSNKILWVDDNPNNNFYERKAFEYQGIEFDLARSTEEALNLLENNEYASIISDMGRGEEERAGYELLDKIRDADDHTPFFIYSSSIAPEHKEEAKQRGAQGSTNNPDELYQMVMQYIK